MKDKFYVDKALIDYLEDITVAPKYDETADAALFMRQWAKYEGKQELITKLKSKEKNQ